MRRETVVDLRCGHSREIKEVRKNLEAEFPGKKPRCFFIRDTKCKMR